MGEAAHQIATSPHGVVAYAKYVIKAKPTDYVYWTQYTRYEGGCKRDGVLLSDVPKPIRLLEMLNEPHAPA